MRTGIRRFEAFRMLRLEPKALIIIGVAEDEDACPAVIRGALDPLLNQRCGNSFSAPIQEHGYRPKAKCTKRCRHSRKHDVPTQDGTFDRDKRYDRVAVSTQLIHQIGFSGSRK